MIKSIKNEGKTVNMFYHQSKHKCRQYSQYVIVSVNTNAENIVIICSQA